MFILTVLLLISPLSGIQASLIKDELVVRAGQNVTLLCRAGHGIANIEATLWKKNDVTLATENQAGTQISDTYPDFKLEMNGEGSLILYNITMLDMGNFTCNIIYKDIDVKEKSSFIRLVVQDVPSPPGRPTVTHVKSRSALVSWQKSQHENNSPITVYIIVISKVADSWKLSRNVRVEHSRTNFTIGILRPHTSYHVKMYAKNSVGQSLPSDVSNIILTESEVPEATPSNVRAFSEDSSVIRVEWNPPDEDKTNGQLKGYILTYRIVSSETVHDISVEDPNKTSMVIHGVKPYTQYRIGVRAFNTVGPGPEKESTVRTAQGVPSAPRITHISSKKARSLHVHWEPPEVINGNLRSYELQWTNNETHTRIISGHLTNPMTALIQGLEPYTTYKIKVAAYTLGGRGAYSDLHRAMTDVEGPSPPTVVNVTVTSPNSVDVRWEAPKIYFRTLDAYIIQCQYDNGNDKSRDFTVEGTLTEKHLTSLPSNKDYTLIMAGISRSIFHNEYFVGEYSDPVYFTLYDPNNTVSEESDNETSSHKIPEIVVKDPAVQETYDDEDSSLTAGVVAGIVCTVIIILLVILLLISYRFVGCRKYYQAASHYFIVPSNNVQSSPPPPPVPTATEAYVEEEEELTYPDIPVLDFKRHIESLHADGDIGFSQEFDEINKRTRVDLKSENSDLQENRSKNRYVNISAFDHSRVVLKPIVGPKQRHTDYINANYIDGYKQEKTYIATQGPLPQTFADFWRMIWEQRCTVIVMITNLTERGRRKCDMYWPEEGTETYGAISVRHINTYSRAHYTVRMFSIKHSHVRKKSFSERVIYQYHYTEWPDHGVPDYTLPVLSYIHKSAVANPEGAGPIVVHCSAGVGRTGTYILIDSMQHQIQDVGSINVAGFLLHIRKQRNFLVQTEEQYMFIHDALLEYLLSQGSTVVKGKDLCQCIEDIEKSSVTIEEQYKLATSYRPSSSDLSHATKLANVEKSRDIKILPVNLKRVILPARPGVDGSDYINATYLHGFSRTKEFVVTQHPTEKTTEDFWRMVWDQNSAIIVLLSQVDEKLFKEFWPVKDNPIRNESGNFNIVFREDYESETHIFYDFLLESTQDDYILMTKMIMCTSEWPGSCDPISSVFDFIEVVKESRKFTESGPVIIIDKSGGVVAGKFCALWTLYDELEHDGTVDIYHLCKLYHAKRPGIVGSQDDYLFLYQAAASLHEEMKKRDLVSSASSHSSPMKNGTLPHHGGLQRSHTHNSMLSKANSHNNSTHSPSRSCTLPSRATSPQNKKETRI